MANTNVAFGLKPINTAGSTPATGGVNAYPIGSSAAAIFQGTPVKCDNGGSIVVGSASGDTVAFVGVFQDVSMFQPLPERKCSRTHGPVQEVQTQISRSQDLCMITHFSASSSLQMRQLQMKQPQKQLFLKTHSWMAAQASTTTGISSAKMDVATLDSSNASLPLKIVGILDDVDNEDFAAAGIPMIVMINNHALLQADSEAAIS